MHVLRYKPNKVFLIFFFLGGGVEGGFLKKTFAQLSQ